MDERAWRAFLNRLSQDLLRYSDPDELSELPPNVRSSGWFGYPGATEEELAAAEARLGARLPPSYRAFLAVTNGWHGCDPHINRLLPTAEVDWLRVREPATSDYRASYLRLGVPPPARVPDEEYYVYGEEQIPGLYRPEYLQTALAVSERGDADSTIYLLNPQVITPEGEWEAWFFATWLPGANRYRSFWELMHAQHALFLQLRGR